MKPMQWLGGFALAASLFAVSQGEWGWAAANLLVVASALRGQR